MTHRMAHVVHHRREYHRQLLPGVERRRHALGVAFALKYVYIYK